MGLSVAHLSVFRTHTGEKPDFCVLLLYLRRLFYFTKKSYTHKAWLSMLIPSLNKLEVSVIIFLKALETQGVANKDSLACLETIYCLSIFISTCSKSASQLGRLI